MQPLSGNWRPDHLTSLMNMSLVLPLPRVIPLSRSCSNVPTLPSLLEMLQNPHVLLTFRTLQNSLRKTTSELSKAVRKRSQHVVLLTFWLRNVLRATTACTFFDISTSKRGPSVVCFVHFDLEMCFAPQTACTFFDISTSKSGPGVVCFVHFDLETCFAPQRRALFWHLNFQKCSGRSGRDFFGNLFTCKCASRHNGVQLFISHLARWLRTRRFKRAYFSTLRSHKSLEKNTVFRDFATFSRTWTFFLLTFFWLSSDFLWLSSELSLLWFSFFFSLLFSSLLFSDSSHLCFSSVHNIVWSLTSKLPSIIC